MSGSLSDMDAHDSTLISVQECARLWAVGEMTVYRAIQDGQLPAARIRRSWRIRRADAERMATPTAPVRTDLRSDAGEKSMATASPVGAVAVAAAPASEPQIRIFKNRPWETETDDAAPSAARRSGSARTKKTASVSG